METIQPFLMFEGRAEEAMRFYVELFPKSEIIDLVHYAEGQSDAPGSVMKASIKLGKLTLLCTDSVVKHAFTFTPALSLFVECESEGELRRFATALSERGTVHMPVGVYGFSRLFSWVSDRFGVSWQLNLR